MAARWRRHTVESDILIVVGELHFGNVATERRVAVLCINRIAQLHIDRNAAVETRICLLHATKRFPPGGIGGEVIDSWGVARDDAIEDLCHSR